MTNATECEIERNYYFKLCAERSDAIERLQADNRRWSKVADERSKENCALRQQNERLRAAGKVLASIFEDDAESGSEMQFVSWSTTTYRELRAAVATFDLEQTGD